MDTETRKPVVLNTKENIREILWHFIPDNAIIMSYEIISNGFEIKYRIITKYRGGTSGTRDRLLKIQDIPQM